MCLCRDDAGLVEVVKGEEVRVVMMVSSAQMTLPTQPRNSSNSAASTRTPSPLSFNSQPRGKTYPTRPSMSVYPAGSSCTAVSSASLRPSGPSRGSSSPAAPAGLDHIRASARDFKLADSPSDLVATGRRQEGVVAGGPVGLALARA